MEYDNMIYDLQMQIEKLKDLGFNAGFMKSNGRMIESVPVGPDVTIRRTMIADRRDRIYELTTTDEFLHLTRVTFESSKEDISKYVEIIQKLLDEGVFDKTEPEKDNPSDKKTPESYGSQYLSQIPKSSND